MRKFLRITAIIILVLLIAYFIGPRPAKAVYASSLPTIPADVEQFVLKQEASHKLKTDNEARIIWVDSSKRKTNFSIVYLHGFSASQEEGDPVHIATAKKFGCNLYLSRLAEHGIDTIDPLKNLTVEKYWESAKQALQIGKQLGRRVIIMGTSTGASLALKIAAEFPRDVYGLVLLSPNIKLFDENAYLLNNPWGLQIARMILKSNYIDSKDQRPIYKQYWNSHYPIEAVVQLEEFLETGMTEETFKKVTQPTLMLYYFKDKVHQDSVVNVLAMTKMFDQLGTAGHLKRAVNIPTAGNHVLGSPLKSKDVESVMREVDAFMTELLRLQRKEP
ncbi:MAG TPA: hypothetical protein VJT83_02855 [Chitinophagaceae bacterium]|nr:hypothetical protein [Chitinophagaceae bacterium]